VYYSQAPVRYGAYMVKVSVASASENLLALRDARFDPSDEFSALRDAVMDFFKTEGAEYEFRVQLCTDLDKMPIEDASAEWPEEESPYRPVARITLPPQDAYSPARRVYFDDVLSFSPARPGGAPAAGLDHARPAEGLRPAGAIPARDERAAAGGAAAHRRGPGLNRSANAQSGRLRREQKLERLVPASRPCHRPAASR
jgi:hypothetical protein